MRTLPLVTAFALAASALIGCSDDDSSDDDDVVRDSGTTDSGTRNDGGLDAGPGLDGSVNIDAGGGSDASLLARNDGGWTVFGYDAGPNPAANIGGYALALRAGDGGTSVTLAVTGLPSGRTFGSHVHKLACNDNLAGGHYQNRVAPDGGANDPMYANPENEIWLDFTTNSAGTAMQSATVNFIPRRGEAKSVVVHEKATADGGVAGAKLSCTDLPF